MYLCVLSISLILPQYQLSFSYNSSYFFSIVGVGDLRSNTTSAKQHQDFGILSYVNGLTVHKKYCVKLSNKIYIGILCHSI